MTTLDEILSPDDLQAEIDAGYVKANNHPSLPLTIYTYSRDCQYEGRWNNVTTLCRGLILDGHSNVVARPFSKFFNYGEHGVRDYAPALEVEPFEVYEKIDGSLGILFWYDDKWIVASKGSFISEQARWAQDRVTFASQEARNCLDKELTYCCEIIYPENRIVVNYGNRTDLVLLGAFTPDGNEVPLAHLESHWFLGDVVRSFTVPTIDDLLARTASNMDIIDDYAVVNGTDAEGYVLRFASGLRVKIKYAEYIRLHRILTGINERDIWRALAYDEMAELGLSPESLSRALKCSTDEIKGMEASPSGAMATIVEGCPDEFDQWVRGISLALRQKYHMYVTEAKLVFAQVREGVGLENRAEFAKLLTSKWGHNKTIVSSVFSMLDSKPVAPIIWRALYPSASTPFVEDEEG